MRVIVFGHGRLGINLCRQLEEMKIEYDVIDVDTNESNITGEVIIDFSTAQATERLLDYALSRKTPLVIATTGQSQVQLDMIKNASMIIPIMKQSNFSFGIFALKKFSNNAKIFSRGGIAILSNITARTSLTPLAERQKNYFKFCLEQKSIQLEQVRYAANTKSYSAIKTKA